MGLLGFGARPTPNQRRPIGTGQRLHPWKDFWNRMVTGGAEHIFTEISMGFSAILPQFSIIYIVNYMYIYIYVYICWFVTIFHNFPDI